MRVLVGLEEHFLKKEGCIFASTVSDYAFWQRYLSVFEEVVVFARTTRVSTIPSNAKRADGAGVSFFEIPDFYGVLGYLRHCGNLKSLAHKAVKDSDAYILRVPGIIGTLLWKELVRQRKPYGVEVVGDPWDSLGPGSVKSLFRPIVRRLMKHDLMRQCKLASAASYVTEYSLQSYYPTPAWNTHYSSIELSADAIASKEAIEKRLTRIKDKSATGQQWQICFAGTMFQLYKAPDILIDAVAECIKKGYNIELIMLGDGRFRPQLEKQSQTAGIASRVKFLGQLPSGQAVYEQFDRADLYVLPSRQEGLPRSVIEAMARGLPCITTTVGGNRELIEPDFMVAPNDVQLLAAKIMDVLSNQQKLLEAVRRNVMVASHYENNRLNQRRIEFYMHVKDMIKNKK